MLEMYGASSPKNEQQMIYEEKSSQTMYGTGVDTAQTAEKESIAGTWKKKRKPTLDEVVFDSCANVLKKKPPQLIQNDLAFYEAWRKREQVQFNTDGPAIITKPTTKGKRTTQSKKKDYNRGVANMSKTFDPRDVIEAKKAIKAENSMQNMSKTFDPRAVAVAKAIIKRANISMAQ